MADLAHREVYTISRPKGRRGLRTSEGGAGERWGREVDSRST